ncbi:tRNA 2-thiocytidine(32) synthetase TtcA [Tianweitania sp.]|uniref:tRNA 2-thiocytidine(32) synthetase TtcA n=1 Tax=Tianweitania sp. TaxID=2021634 RepID=UPI00289A2CA4|nr:tRNA 2-thiocytidine(32) synthetase TtcA [Tianweitania sp.]
MNIHAPIQPDPSDELADACHPMFREVPGSVGFNKLRKRLLRNVRQAIEDFAMVTPGQRWLVALSGGKDSYGLMALLLDLKGRGLLPVELIACNLDQGQPNFPKHILPDYLTKHGIAHRIEYQDTYSVVTDKLPETSTYCSLCSRLRRGHLYRVAREEGCQALVLGHHREDILETFFLNLFHGGRLAAMPPKLLNDEGDVLVLRPLSYCAESDLTKLADAMAFPIIPCDLCGSQEGLQRNSMKAMLSDIEARMPGRKDTMIRALSNTRPSHLLDRDLFDFSSLMPKPQAD